MIDANKLRELHEAYAHAKSSSGCREAKIELMAHLLLNAPSIINLIEHCERLEAALEPFAECCDQIADTEDDEEWAKFRLLIKNYRAARQALAKEPE